jgi:hypothetical protein
LRAVKKTLANTQDKREIEERLEKIRPDSKRQWGKMTAPQMVCHLCDSFRGVMGEKPVARAKGFYPRRLMRWIALNGPMQWPHGLKTMPEMDQQIGGTPPTQFEKDVRELRRLLDRFARQPRDFQWAPHPIFLEMPEEDWMRWGYLHMDHHFRQFGV